MNSLLLTVLLILQGANPAPAGKVTGRLLTEGGLPAAGVRVMAMPVPVPDPASPQDDAPMLVSLSQSDADGNYRLENIPPGNYYIAAGPIDFPTYYPGGSRAIAAKSIAITAGSTQPGIDFTVMTDIAVKVTGRVVREPKVAPIPSQTVRLLGGTAVPGKVIPVAPDGTFEFVGVRPGSYQISLSRPAGLQPKSISVADKDLIVEIVIPVTSAITGTMTVDGNGLPPLAVVAFEPIVTGNAPFQAEFGRLLGSGSTLSTNLPIGEYRVKLGTLPAGYTVRSITSGKTDLLKDSFVVKDALHQIAVNIGVSAPPPWVKLSGKITGGDGLAIRGQIFRLNSQTAGVSLEASVKSDGSFEFPMVLPGTYSGRMQDFTRAAIPALSIVVPEGHEDIRDIAIALPALVEVVGRVVVEGGGTSPSVGFTVNGALGQFRVSPSARRADGVFSIFLQEGEQSITAVTPVNAQLSTKSLTYGTQNLLAGRVKISKTDNAELQLVLAPPPLRAVNGVKVSGRIVNIPEGRPAIRSSVSMTVSNGIRIPDSPMNTDGTFEFSNVPPGNYQITAGLLGIRGTISIVVGSTDLTGVEIRLPQSVEVRGRATLDGSSPMPRFNLVLTDSGGQNTFSSPVAADGSFTLNLPEGEFTAAVQPRTLPAGLSVTTLTYGGTDLLRDRIKISASPTDELHITYKSEGTPTFKISGHIVNGGGATVGINGGFGGSGQSLQTTTKSDGSFEFENVPPGRYMLRSSIQLGTTTSLGSIARINATVAVIVGNSDVTGVELIVPKSKEVSIRVVSEGNAPIPSFLFQLSNGSNLGSVSIRSGASSMRTALPMEGWSLSPTNLPAGYSVTAMTYGSIDLLREPLRMADSDATEILVTIAATENALHKITGRVTGFDPKASAAIVIQLIGNLSSSTATIDSNGSFEFAKVPAGNYSVFIFGGTVTRVPVVVGSKDVSGVEINIAPPAR